MNTRTDADERANRSLGIVALGPRVHIAFERYPTVRHRRAHAVFGSEDVPLEGVSHGSGDVGVGAITRASRMSTAARFGAWTWIAFVTPRTPVTLSGIVQS
jgi:hypothetical protein